MAAYSLELDDIADWEYVTDTPEVVDIEVGEHHNFYLDCGGKPILVHNSGKTYSLCQLICLYWLKKFTGYKISIVRKELNTARTTVMADFIEICTALGMWDDANFSKSNLTYKYNGNIVEFIGMDKAAKKRGAKRNILYINEANELTYEDWFQLLIRTTDRIYLDYNPSDEYHWIYDKVLTRPDCTFIQSTYLDNYDFLPASLIEEIENIDDEEYFKVYVLGERATSANTIYTNWQTVKPEEIDKAIADGAVVTYGLDFGFNHPNALVMSAEIPDSNIVYVRQLIYKSGLTTAELIDEMKALKLPKNAEIFADAARPDTILEIAKHGFNIKKADKTVYEGIQVVKSKKLMIDNSGGDLLKEIKAYKWRTNRAGENLDEPVKLFDDGMDGLRYSVFNSYLNHGKKIGKAKFGFRR